MSLPIDSAAGSGSSPPPSAKALLIRDQTCRADGCEVPGTWCDAHHLGTWHTGYRTDRLPNGDPRFHRRK